MPATNDCANAIRALSMDAVERARSGHPGAPMGMADLAEVLWRDYLRVNPANPRWPDRDRFVLSNGHGSMLLYSVLHLTGFDLSMDDIRNFRQLGAPTAGHPEYGEAPGVETTTGPLGQGLANGVGMALAEKVLGARYNRDGHDVVDHRTWVFLGDGCLMEGISHEAASLAGVHRLGKLICVYDDNGVSIDGPVSGWFGDDTPARFAAYGWHVIAEVDGHDREAIRRAYDAALADPRPSLICARTIIGYGSPNKAGTAAAHGPELGPEEVARTREQLGWAYPPFEIPDEIRAAWDRRAAGAAAEADWRARLAAYRAACPDLAAEFERVLDGELPAELDGVFAELQGAPAAGPIESRKASGQILAAIAPRLPELFGGSADLSGSNSTKFPGATTLTPQTPDANYLHYGVREFAMTAIANGIALHGGLIPYTGTFLTFLDYARNAVRMAALMGLRNVLVYTHDSLAVGEDGPTHQPVEHLTSLRTTPNMSVWRPCDVAETAAAWRAALVRRAGPTALVLSRQKIDPVPRAPGAAIARGGYVLVDAEDARAIVIATGSEVPLAVEAARTLAAQGIAVRVVSMPCADVFDAQDRDYRDRVLPPQMRARVAVEAAHPDWWRRYVGIDGAVVGVGRFGRSAPAAVLMREYGITSEAVVAAVQEVVGR